MEELDLLKKDWKKNENSFVQKSEMDIYKMIHLRSSSIVKWILIISVFEFFFWTFINIFFNSDEIISKRFSKDISNYIIQFNLWFSIVNYIFVSLFIYLFYKNYKNISTTNSIKKLMTDILKTRKTVNYYVNYNLLMLSVGIIIVFGIQVIYSEKMRLIREKIIHDTTYHITLLKIIGIVALAIAVSVFLFWAFYKLIYGILLKKLNKNYKELKNMEL